MSPKASHEETVEQVEVEAQAAEPTQYVEPRDVVVGVEVNCRTDDPDVTDDQIAAAAQQQVTLPNTIWIDKPEGGQIPVAVISAAQEVEEPVVP